VGPRRASIGQPGPFERDAALAEAGLARIREFHGRWHGRGDGRVSAAVAAWAPDLCSPELLGRVRKLQDELDVLATLHLSQIWGEVAAIREQRGVTPVEYVARCGLLSPRLIAAHCRCMSAEEESTLGASGAAVAINPAIAARRGLAARIDELERAAVSSRSAPTTWPRTWWRSCARRCSWSACAAPTAAGRRRSRR